MTTKADGSVIEIRELVKESSRDVMWRSVYIDEQTVVRNATIRTLLSAAASEKMHLMQFDVSTTFLYGQLDEEIYMEQPEGFSDNSDRVCKLKRSLYGLKQAPRCWNRQFAMFLQKLGFRQCDANPCLFIMKTDSVKLILALYVDDGLVGATDDTALSELVQ